MKHRTIPLLAACGLLLAPGLSGCEGATGGVGQVTCHINAYTPTGSGARIKAVADMKCSGNVESAVLDIAIQHMQPNGQFVNVGGWQSNAIGSMSSGITKQRAAYVPCRSGKFRTLAKGKATYKGVQSGSVSAQPSSVAEDPCR